MARQRIYSLQGLRAVSFLAIFISHTGLGNYGCLGAWGVSVFFILSGFLMTLSQLNKNDEPHFSFRFAWNKIRPLYPLHIVTMLLAAVYAAYCGQHLMKVCMDMLIHSLLVQMWIPNTQFYTTLNGPSWYLCASIFLYLCFPLVFNVIRKCWRKGRRCIYFGMMLMALVYALIAAVSHIYAPQDGSAWFTTQWIVYYFPPVRLIDFTAGCLMGYLFHGRNVRTQPRQIKSMTVVAELAVCAMIIVSWSLYANQYGILGSQAFRFSMLFMPTSLALIWLIACGEGALARILESKVPVKIGDLSPYTFLLHGVAIKYCAVLFQYLNLSNKAVIAIAAFALTMTAAFVWKPVNNKLLRS